MDVDVFKQRFLPFHPKLYRIAYALLDNKADAEDILQDAYCKLWNKRDELGDIQNPEAFSINIGQKSLSGFPALAQSKPKRQRRGIGDRSINDRLLAGKGIGRKRGYPAYTRTDRTAPREPEAGNPPAWY